MFFFAVGRIFGLAMIILYYHSICSSLSTLLQGFVLVQQHLNFGGKPVTVKVVFQEVETVIAVKIVEDSDNKKHGLQLVRAYVIPVFVTTLFVRPLESDVYLRYPYPELV